jgi:hypothetical protein
MSLRAMRVILAVLTIAAWLAGAPARAQEPEAEEVEEMETDRDSFTPAISTVAPCRLMVESAYTFVDNPDTAETHSFPELLVRLGVAEWLELRLGGNYEVGGESSGVSSGSPGVGLEEEGGIEEESNVSYGAKFFLTAQDAWLPASIVNVQAITPTSGPETATRLIATYGAGWRFANGWQWDSSIRYGLASAEGDHFNQWAPSTVLKVPVGERVNAHAEYFGIFTDGLADETVKHYVSPGVHYLVTENLEVGVRVGWGLNDQSADFFSNVGFGWLY